MEEDTRPTFNMGLATIYRLHECLSYYEAAMRLKDPNRMYDELKILHFELQAEMEEKEITENNKLIKNINSSIQRYNLIFFNQQRLLQKYPNKKLSLALPNVVFDDLSYWALHLKRIMKRLKLHMPMKDFDPAGDFGRSY